MFSDFIKHYDNIRGILRNIFLYGCYSREGLEGKTAVSARKISYEIRRIQQYLEKDFIKIDMDGRNKLLNLSYDPILSPNNFLVSTYFNKSFTKIDIVLYFYILMCVNLERDGLSANAIEELLIDMGTFDFTTISSKTIERKLKEMSNELGILNSYKDGRCNKYKVDTDILKDLDNSEIIKLFDLVTLFKNINFSVVAGHYFENTLRDYACYERDWEISDKDIFQYKNLHFHPVIEEEILWETFKIINNKKHVTYESVDKRRNFQKSNILAPYKIRYDVKYGRYYIISFDKNNRCINTRVDRINKIRTINESTKEKDFKEKYKRAMENSWSAVPINGESKPEAVKFRVVIDKKEDLYILDKIKGELREYKLEADNLDYIFSLKVNSATEMIPWFREYFEFIDVMEPVWLKRKLKKDIEEVLASYGIIS